MSTSNDLDTLIVKQDSLIRRDLKHSTANLHKYTYTLKKDSVFTIYVGPHKVIIPDSYISNFNFDIQNEILTIEMDKVYPGYSGTKFKFLRRLQ